MKPKYSIKKIQENIEGSKSIELAFMTKFPVSYTVAEVEHKEESYSEQNQYVKYLKQERMECVVPETIHVEVLDVLSKIASQIKSNSKYEIVWQEEVQIRKTQEDEKVDDEDAKLKDSEDDEENSIGDLEVKTDSSKNSKEKIENSEEKSELRNYKMEVQLGESQSYEPVKFDLTSEEREVWAMKYKTKGGEFYKQKNFEKALEYFTKGYTLIEWDTQEQVTEVKTALCLNIALLNINFLKNYNAAINFATKAINLSPINVKGFYRRGNAFLERGDFDMAIADFKDGLKIEKGNSGLLQALKQARKQKASFVNERKQMFGKVLNKNIYEEKNTCCYSDSMNPVITATLTTDNSSMVSRIELFSNIASDLLIPFKKVMNSLFECQTHAKNNYTLFELELKEPLQIELNKSSYLAKFKNEGTLFFWVNQDKIEEKGKIKTLKLDSKVTLGISTGPLTWFDGEHCAFGWICSRDTKLLDYLKVLNSEKPQLKLSFSKDKGTVF